MISDHSLVSWTQSCIFQPPLSEEKIVRRWSGVDRAAFLVALRSSDLCATAPQNASADSLFDTYDGVLRELADKFAPARLTRPIRCQKIAVWFDDECRKLRRKSRMFERRYRKTKRVDDRKIWFSTRESVIGSIASRRMDFGCLGLRSSLVNPGSFGNHFLH